MGKGMCFVCLTQYQYIVSDSLARNIYREQKVKSLIVLKYFCIEGLKDNDYAEYIVIPQGKYGKIFSLLFTKTILYKKSKIFDYISKGCATFSFFNDRDPISQRCSKIARKYGCELLLIEEGLGTYCAIAPIKPIGTLIVPDKAMVGFTNLYRENHNDEVELVSLNYSEIFSEENMGLYVKKTKINNVFRTNHIDEFDILFLGQSVENEEYRSYEMDFINRIKAKYPEINILIKPHPRDNNSYKYIDNSGQEGVMIFPDILKGYPVESIIRMIKVNVVVSLFSSGGITLANIFPDINTIYIFDLYNTLPGDSANKIKMFKKYLKNVYIPSSFDDAIETIGNSYFD